MKSISLNNFLKGEQLPFFNEKFDQKKERVIELFGSPKKFEDYGNEGSKLIYDSFTFTFDDKDLLENWSLEFNHNETHNFLIGCQNELNLSHETQIHEFLSCISTLGFKIGVRFIFQDVIVFYTGNNDFRIEFYFEATQGKLKHIFKFISRK